MKSPLVSVLMPVYNGGEYLRPAVESVLAQTYQNWELIIIDDGSTDGCVAQLDGLRDARVRKFRQKNAGKPVAMNRGLSVARGVFYALQDADDLSHPDRLQQQVSCLMANPDIAGVFCGHELILDGQRVAPVFRAKSAKDCAFDIAAGSMPAHDPTGMYRLSFVRDLRYAEDLPIVEGFDYILRVGERFQLMVVGECLYGYRIHSQSVTKMDLSRRNRLLQEAYDRMHDRRGQPRQPLPSSTTLSSAASRLRDADNDLVSHFTASVADLVLAGRRGEALRTGLACWKMHPACAYYMKPFLYAWTPHAVMKMYRERKRRGEEMRVRNAHNTTVSMSETTVGTHE